METVSMVTSVFSYLIATILVLILPGLTLSLLLVDRKKFDLIDQFIMAPSLSIAAIPIILLFFSIAKIEFTQTTAFLTIAFFLILLFYIVFTSRAHEPPLSSKKSHVQPDYWPYALLLLLIIVSLGVRLIPIHSFIVPPGHDPQFHSIITTLIIEQKGIPNSYNPYSPIDTFTYSFGLHSIVAFFHFFTNEGIARLILVLSAAFNAMILLPTYLLVKKISNSNASALLSSLLIGLVGILPSKFIIYGKNAHLTAFVVLPVAILFLYYVFRTGQRNYMLLAIISSAGLFLIHYRVYMFYLLFWATLLLIAFANFLIKHKKDGNHFIKLFFTPLIGVMFVLPWIQHVLIKIYSITTDTFSYNQIGLVSIMSPHSLLFILDRILNSNGFLLCIFTLLGIGVILIGKKKEALPFIIWLFALILFVTDIPFSLGIPGANLVNSESIYISLFLPLSILGGYAIYPLSQVLQKRTPLRLFHFCFKPKFLAAIICLMVLSTSIFSVFQVYSTYASSNRNVLVSGDDLEAMKWIKENTLPNSTFWSQAHHWQALDVILGIDAGYWIPILSNRPNAIPIIPYLNEIEGQPTDYFDNCRDLIELLSDRPLDPETLSSLKDLDIDYIFVGKRVFGGPAIDSQLLANSPYYELVYQDESAYIFKINFSYLQFDSIT